MALLLVGGCALVGRPSGLTIRIPHRPVLDETPQAVRCKAGEERGTCYVIWGKDWDRMNAHMQALERELEGACIKIGQMRLPPDWRTNRAMRDEADRLVKQGCWAPATD